MNIIYVTGGARSGKSAFAQSLAERYENPVFLATAEGCDQEMMQRIFKHQQERGERFHTLEEPLFPEKAFAALPENSGVVLMDCMTVWVGNLMHHVRTDEAITERIDALLDILSAPPCDVILVSGEVGMGIVPENSLARRFRDIAGKMNQRVAARATEAWLLCSGIPLRLK